MGRMAFAWSRPRRAPKSPARPRKPCIAAGGVRGLSKPPPLRAAAAARLHSRETRDGAALSACQAVVRAAKQRHVDLHSDAEILEHATAAIARIDDELERLRKSGDLRPVNKSYQSYRHEAAAKGERVVPYAQWMLGYREELVRKLAATLRYL